MSLSRCLRKTVLAALLGGSALCVAGPAAAQSLLDFAGSTPAAPVTTSVAAPAAPVFIAGGAQPGAGQALGQDATVADVDLSALRYFAQTGDTRRYEAEVARLRVLHPGWTPPADPLATPVVRDEWLDAMWALYGEGRLVELNAEIARRQAAEPAWAVPDDLRTQLALAEVRERIVGASDLRQFGRVLELADEAQALLTCQDLDLMWRVAEAFAETGAKDRARDAYAFVLQNCEGPSERVATVQKATLLLDRELLQDLFALDRAGDGSGGTELGTVRDDVARNMVMLGGSDRELPVREDDLERLSAIAEAATSPDDSTLLGWYHFRRDDVAQAGAWFERAMAIEAGPSQAQGLAIVRIAGDDLVGAEDVMYPFRDASPEAHAVYMAAVSNVLANDPRGDVPEEMLRCLDPERVPLPDAVLERMAPEIIEVKDVPAAQNMGWYAFSFGQFDASAKWFATALEWDPDHEPSAYGLVLSLVRLGDAQGVAQIQAVWEGRSPRIARLGEICDEDGRVVEYQPVTRPLPRPAARSYLPASYADRLGLGAGTIAGTGPDLPYAAPAMVSSASGRMVTRADSDHVETLQVSSRQLRVSPTVSTRSFQEYAEPITVAASVAAPARAAASARPSASRGAASARPAASRGASSALATGWAMMEANRPQEAIPAFKSALESGSSATRKDAAYGLSLAYMRLGLTDKAALAINQAPQTPERNAELQTAILADQAIAAFDAGQYARALNALDRRARIAPERIDLMVLRGWSYHKLGRFDEARRACGAAARAGSADGAKCAKVAEKAYWGEKQSH